VTGLPAVSGFAAGFDRVFRDAHFWIAAGAGILFWTGLFLWVSPTPDPWWPVRQFRQFLYLTLLFPVLEEVIFRGYVQGMLLRWRYGRRAWLQMTAANVLTSVLFTALHFLSHPPLAAAAVIVPSLIFGYFRDRHGNIHAAVVLHVFYNAGYLWLFSSASRAG
jgi:membrane protease YdiL (CAAX protease family)